MNCHQEHIRKAAKNAPVHVNSQIVRHIVEQGMINPSADGNWTFKSMADTTVLFETGPAGQHYLDDVESVAIEPAGEGEGGFATYRIALDGNRG